MTTSDHTIGSHYRSMSCDLCMNSVAYEVNCWLHGKSSALLDGLRFSLFHFNSIFGLFHRPKCWKYWSSGHLSISCQSREHSFEKITLWVNEPRKIHRGQRKVKQKKTAKTERQWNKPNQISVVIWSTLQCHMSYINRIAENGIITKTRNSEN